MKPHTVGVKRLVIRSVTGWCAGKHWRRMTRSAGSLKDYIFHSIAALGWMAFVRDTDTMILWGETTSSIHNTTELQSLVTHQWAYTQFLGVNDCRTTWGSWPLAFRSFNLRLYFSGLHKLNTNLVGYSIQNLGTNDDEKAESMLTPLSNGFVAVLLTRPLTVTLIRWVS